MSEAYPLAWPAGWPRSKNRKSAAFKVDMSKALDHLYNELDLIKAKGVVVSSNMQVRLDGRLLSKQNQIGDPGVAVYFSLNGQQQCIPCDKWDSVKDNIRAVGLTVEALRGLERWGAKEMVDAAFAGFKALPESVIVTPNTKRPWHEVLEVSPTASQETIRAAYRSLLHKYHPDKGGDVAKFQEVQNAFKEPTA
jgi:hypothetical protein